MTDHLEPSPINPLPAVVTVLALALFGVEVILAGAARGLWGGASGIGWRNLAVNDYGFFAEAVFWMLANGEFRFDFLQRFVTYPFVHAGFTHALFAIVFVLALGKWVGEIFRPWAVLVVFFGSAVGGALAYAFLSQSAVPLIGAYPAAYGLIGAYSYVLWLMAGAAGKSQLAAFQLIGFLMAIQLLFSVLFGGGPDWIADLGGFASGFVLSFVVSPGGWLRLRSWARRG